MGFWRGTHILVNKQKERGDIDHGEKNLGKFFRFCKALIFFAMKEPQLSAVPTAEEHLLFESHQSNKSKATARNPAKNPIP